MADDPEAASRRAPRGEDADASRAAEALRAEVHDGERYRPFGELTTDDVDRRAVALREAAGWGPTQRVAAVARAWKELGDEMRSSGAGRVSELEPVSVVSYAERLWVLAPRGGLI